MYPKNCTPKGALALALLLLGGCGWTSEDAPPEDPRSVEVAVDEDVDPEPAEDEARDDDEVVDEGEVDAVEGEVDDIEEDAATEAEDDELDVPLGPIEPPDLPPAEPDREPASWTTELEPCAFGLDDAFSRGGIAPPDREGGYEAPDEVQRAALAASLEAASDGDAELALGFAEDAGYAVCRLGALDVALWRPAPGSGRPIIAWRFDAARPVLVGVPHPFNERGTLTQGRHAFANRHVRLLVVSGTHRCASETTSGCDGTTGVCDDHHAAYRLSDPAHSDGTLFHVAHATLARLHPDDVVLSLHGMADDGFSISNGTHFPAASEAPVVRVTRALTAAFPENAVTTCNPYPGLVLLPRLCGTTNLQGRLLNEAGDAEAVCGAEAEYASERFLHIEQGRGVRRTPKKAMDVVLRAL